MKLKILFMVLFVQGFICALNSQATLEWAKRFAFGRDPMEDQAKSVAVDGQGNVYVTGKISNSTTVYLSTIKYNSSGTVQWIKTYDNPSTGGSVAVDGAGNVYVSGAYYNGPVNDYDILTVKYNSSGLVMWSMLYNGPANGDDYASNIGIDGGGNVIVSGQSDGSSGSSDYVVIKYDDPGTLLWAKRYNGTDNYIDRVYSMAIDVFSNVYVTGVSAGLGTIYDIATIKYNASGTAMWTQRYNGSSNGLDEGNSVAVDGSGNVYVTGGSDNGTNMDYITIKYNSAGSQQWSKTFDNGNDDEAISVKTDGSGNIYVTGWSFGSGKDIATIKYDPSGSQIWFNRYLNSGWDIPYAMATDGSGNVYVTGESFAGQTQFDFITIRYNSGGNQNWVKKYNGPGDDRSNAITVDASANVYVTGRSEGTVSLADYLTIKYSQSGDNMVFNNNSPEFKLNDNYPNPFNPTTNIEFTIPNSTLVKLTVYDMLGREVQTLVNGQLNAGTHNAKWNASKYPSGVYFYKLVTDNFTETKKMILVK